MEQEFKLIAKTFMGLEPVLAQELIQLGANNVETGRRMVSFTGDKEMMYRANFQLHTAIRILKPIHTFKARSAEEVYDEIQKIEWSNYLDNKKTFSVDSVVYSEEFRNSRFVTYKVKDAIVDWFREKTGTRPNISVSNPDIRLNIHIAEDDATLSLDSSGESLHRRGYRQESVEAPLNEVLAAGMILMTGWKGDTDFIDPMCGSGTIAIEAALIARNISPGVFRKEFAFEKWADFDQELFDTIYNDDSKEKEFTHHIYGYDIDMKAVNTARINVKAAGLSKEVTIEQADFKDFQTPTEKSIMVTNPPYGERISTPNLLATYKMIGERLKHTFAGNDAWILSYREECFEQIGLKPSIKIPVFNGSLECEFRKYALFDGRMKEFRADGGIVKTDAEKREMAQKHRFKKEREFKKRLDEQEANEEGDIRSFSFHKHDIGDLGFRKERTGRNDGDERRTGRNERGGKRFGRGDREERGFGRFDRSKRDERGGKRFERGSKRFDRPDKRGGLGKKNRRFDDED
ncbi:MAG: RNA methyltransferase [Prevotella buccae]|jgi:putative N6-adenine-specific DNA methylase|uniref:THUMP domain-containing class I SAM-dependent RNA methyltransferase n=1 Tax=Segatella buccae TaxID=28126 RepID=UPI0001C41565|nr:THUMP domain-containing protein [Segatella buccae]EFC76974.1 THUMP domain protein [Segatella buccae D17]MBS5896267.1 RNA methyltransferase [Segatella buccae]